MLPFGRAQCLQVMVATRRWGRKGVDMGGSTIGLQERTVRDAIVDVLRGLADPCCEEKGISVVDMGLVRDVAVDGDLARVELVLTSGWCPFAARSSATRTSTPRWRPR